MNLTFKRLLLPAIIILVCIALIPTFIDQKREKPSDFEWMQIPGDAIDLDISIQGVAWAVAFDGAVKKWDGSAWVRVGENAIRISAGPAGNTWIVDNQNNLLRWAGGKWIQMPGKATDISVGASGRIWMIGTKEKPGGFAIYKWGLTSWLEVPGAGVRVSTGPKGNPWIINDKQQIMRLTREVWELAPGMADDISIGANGVPWIVYKMLGNKTGAHIYGWNGRDWDIYSGAMRGVAVDSRGRPWAFDAQSRIFAHPDSKALNSQ